jgi:hypothetical protein
MLCVVCCEYFAEEWHSLAATTASSPHLMDVRSGRGVSADSN